MSVKHKVDSLLELKKEKEEVQKLVTNQCIMMEAMADQYEQNLQNQLTNMEVQATIYETLLEQGGTTI